MSESPSATERRQRHERELERVGVGTEEGQALLDRWHKEDLTGRTHAGEDTQGRIAQSTDEG